MEEKKKEKFEYITTTKREREKEKEIRQILAKYYILARFSIIRVSNIYSVVTWIPKK